MLLRKISYRYYLKKIYENRSCDIDHLINICETLFNNISQVSLSQICSRHQKYEICSGLFRPMSLSLSHNNTEHRCKIGEPGFPIEHDKQVVVTTNETF